MATTHMQQIQSEGAALSGNAQGEGTTGKKGSTAKRASLVILALFGVALSAVFPYGIGLAVVAWVIALLGALIGVGFATYTLLRELLGKTATFGYAPATAYMAGKKMKKKKTDESSPTKENN
jgi:hypothetical protein